jgi:hypothetical protein
MTAPPAPRPTGFVNVVISKDDPKPLTPTFLYVGLTRKQCRDWITFNPDGDRLRARRARVTLFES